MKRCSLVELVDDENACVADCWNGMSWSQYGMEQVGMLQKTDRSIQSSLQHPVSPFNK